MSGSAIISDCGRYRYLLRRRIPQAVRWIKPCLFVMLNPSTADASTDDPTIRRCVGFARSLLCTEMSVVNLFALRSTDPAALSEADDPVGPTNDAILCEQVAAHSLGIVIVAWGSHRMARERARKLADQGIFATAHALALTKDGWPRHPLYLSADLKPEPWSVPKP